MRGETGENIMEKSDQKVGKIFLTFAGICLIAVIVIVLSAFSQESKAPEAEQIEGISQGFDYDGTALFRSLDEISMEYMEGDSTGRTLSEYYSRRQYPGSPPEIPHPVEVHGARLECLTCHAKGGWTETLKRMTPLTPHPELISCEQCHVSLRADALFSETDWQSISPPRLGRSHLPGAPPPIPHDLQMRGNCIACHVGPGAVGAIRVQHPSRGDCRQCHVPDVYREPFTRVSQSK